MAADLPTFKVPTNQDEWNSHINNFKTVMMECFTKNSKFNIPPRLNILWLIADEDDNVRANERCTVCEFLEIIGYNVECTQTTEPSDIDLLFVSTDREEDVMYLLRTIFQGGLGLMPKYELLVSRLKPTGVSPYRGQPNDFMVDANLDAYGMCIIHEYIMAFQDPGARVGRHNTMILHLENKVWDSAIKAGMAADAYPKKKLLFRLLRCRRHLDGEARWALAVLDLLSSIRNTFVHIPILHITLEHAEEARCRINKLAVEYDRPLNLPPMCDMQGDYRVIRKRLTQLTMMAGSWIDEYLKRYPVKCNEISVIASQDDHEGQRSIILGLIQLGHDLRLLDKLER